jgi:O-methyltransferase
MGRVIKLYRNLTSPYVRSLVFRLRLRWSIFFKVFFLKEDELRLIAKPSFAKDGFSTLHFVGYLRNEPLHSAFQKSLKTLPLTIQPKFSQIAYRAHICCWAYESTKHLRGEMASFGVNFGVLEKTIAELTKNDMEKSGQVKKFYLFDTWGESVGSHEDYKEDIHQEVIDRFKCYSFTNLVKGLIPDSFTKVEINELSLLLIDLNGWEAELAVLNTYYEKVVSGGIIYFDDYGWGYPTLRSVVDQFLTDKSETLLHFASGNAILVKK